MPERASVLWLCRAGDARGDLASDAMIAALALETGATMVTYDRDFARFSGVRSRLPHWSDTVGSPCPFCDQEVPKREHCSSLVRETRDRAPTRRTQPYPLDGAAAGSSEMRSARADFG